MNTNTNDTPIDVGEKSGLDADGISSAVVVEERCEKNTNSSTSCVSSTRKRPFNMLDGNDDTNNAADASSKHIEMQPSSQNNIHQQKISDMQTKLDTVEKEKEELKQKLTRRNMEIGDISVELNTVHNRRVEFEQRCIELTQRNQELEIKVKDLTLKNEYNEWSYTAEDIPASYWIQRGFAEGYISRMKRWLAKMKKFTDRLRKGDPIENLNISNGGIDTNINLLHDDILLPHWRELVNALKQYQKFEYREGFGIEILFLWNIELDREVLGMLAPILNTTIVRMLSFGGYDFGSEMVSFVADILKVNPYIQGIGLYKNRIDSLDDMRRFCKSFTDRYVIREARFGHSFDGNSPEVMQIILDASHQLEKLHLKDNGIGSVGASLIANFLASNPPLTRLEVNENDLNDTDAVLLANALQCNTKLKQIYLEDNDNITAIGRQALLESVFDLSSLNACVASNHTCRLYGLNPNISKTNKYVELSANRTMKTFTMLSATDDGFFNMNYLGEVSYKLIPNVLRLAQKFKGRTPELSDLYFEQTGQRGGADWSNLDEDTLPITSMFELLRGGQFHPYRLDIT